MSLRIRVRSHWRKGMPVKGYIRRHYWLATVKGGPEFKREAEKQKDLFEGPLPVNVRQVEYLGSGTYGVTIQKRFGAEPSPEKSQGLVVEINKNLPFWKDSLKHEAYHVARRQYEAQAREFSSGDEEMGAREFAPHDYPSKKEERLLLKHIPKRLSKSMRWAEAEEAKRRELDELEE